jgi:hypothetical protein
MFHLRRADYSRWFREAVKDHYMADQAERIERRKELHPAESRRLIRSLIDDVPLVRGCQTLLILILF